MLAQSRANEAAEKLDPDPQVNTYLTETVPAECNSIQKTIKDDVINERFHHAQYSSVLKNTCGSKLDCNRIADRFWSFFPEFGVSVFGMSFRDRCRITLHHTVSDYSIERQHKRFTEFKDGGDELQDRELYTGPDPSSCQELANSLNSLNIQSGSEMQVATATMKRNMCEIDIKLVPKP